MGAKRDTLPERLPRPGERRQVGGHWHICVAVATSEDTENQVVVFRDEATTLVYSAIPAKWGNVPTPPTRSYKGKLPKAGEHWRHCKGSTYRIICSAIDAKTGHAMVVYKADEGGYVWIRTVDSWNSKRDDIPRFTRIP